MSENKNLTKESTSTSCYPSDVPLSLVEKILNSPVSVVYNPYVEYRFIDTGILPDLNGSCHKSSSFKTCVSLSLEWIMISKLSVVTSTHESLKNAIKSTLANKKNSLVGIYVLSAQFVLLVTEYEGNSTK
jgi:hypothetical protein